MAEQQDTDSRTPDTYQQLVELSTDALFAVDGEGRFEATNEAFLALVGYDRSALLGTPVTDVLAAGEVGEWEQRVNLLSAEAATESDEWSARVVTNNGTEVPVTVRLSERPAAGVAAIITDDRERNRREQKLTILNRVLRHNIRNRMNVILGHAATLQDVDDEGYRTLAERIEEVGNEIVGLSDKARKAHKHLDIPDDEDCRIDLATVTEQVVVTFGISHTNAVVETDLPGEARARAPPAYEVALAELLENAAVHHSSGSGPATVVVDRADGSYTVRVRDECPPVPDSVVECLEQGEQPLDHNEGLGLWIVQWVAETVGGDLSFARRDDDEGNVVTLTFDALEE
jgi:PAS domain S-box-containing protein